MSNSKVVKRYQWMRNAEGGQSFGNRMEIRTLTEDAFLKFIVPRLRSGYVTSLADYQAKHPQDTHYSVMWRESDAEWLLVASGSLEELETEANASGWGMEVDDFRAPSAIRFGKMSDSESFDNDNPEHRQA